MVILPHQSELFWKRYPLPQAVYPCGGERQREERFLFHLVGFRGTRRGLSDLDVVARGQLQETLDARAEFESPNLPRNFDRLGRRGFLKEHPGCDHSGRRIPHRKDCDCQTRHTHAFHHRSDGGNIRFQRNAQRA